MKKSLLALAVLGSFAGVASAQTNVTIYGLVDVAVTRFDNGLPNGDAWSLDGGNFTRNGSRLGFKGSEDLGGGLSAIFQLENGFEADTGTLSQSGNTLTTTAASKPLFGRQAWVGLNSTSAGAIKFGRQYTPMHIALDTIDPFGTGMAGNIEGGLGVAMFSPFGLRMDNTVNYSTPNFSGFSGQAGYAFGEQANSFSANQQYGLGLGYANGPINVQFAYHKAKPATAGVLVQQLDGYMLGGTYDFRVAKIHGAFGENNAENAAGVDTVKNRNYMLGVSAPFGPVTVVASWVRRDDRLPGLVTADADQYAIGAIYDLSKRTNLYTSYGQLNDKGPTNIDRNLFQVGVQHKF